MSKHTVPLHNHFADGGLHKNCARCIMEKAAPELLEALKGMLQWARRVKEKNPGMEVSNACQAIASAEKGGE